MNPINKIPYLGYIIDVFYNTQTNCFSSRCRHMSSNNSYDDKIKNFCHGYETPTGAIDDIKAQIDEFLLVAPESIDELAKAIQESLTYNDEFEAIVDKDVLSMLLKSSTFLNQKY